MSIRLALPVSARDLSVSQKRFADFQHLHVAVEALGVDPHPVVLAQIVTIEFEVSLAACLREARLDGDPFFHIARRRDIVGQVSDFVERVEFLPSLRIESVLVVVFALFVIEEADFSAAIFQHDRADAFQHLNAECGIGGASVVLSAEMIPDG